MAGRTSVVIAPVTLPVRCPYLHCGQIFSVDCEDLHDYTSTVECWHCGGVSVVRFRIRCDAQLLKVEGEQARINDKLDTLERLSSQIAALEKPKEAREA